MEEKLEWSHLEYEEKERSSDWFWALGVIIVTSSIAAIIFGSYFFAALLLISGGLLGFFAKKSPDLMHYELTDRGLKINNRLFLYENIKSFWVQADLSGEKNIRPILFIKSERVFLPIIEVPLYEENAEDIHAIMTSRNIPEEEMREHTATKIMESLGF